VSGISSSGGRADPLLTLKKEAQVERLEPLFFDVQMCRLDDVRMLFLRVLVF